MAPTYLVSQLLAFDPSALIEFLLSVRDDGGGAFDITSITDWLQAPEADRMKLLEKFLSVESHVLAHQEQHIDFDQVIAKLNDIRRAQSAEGQTSSEEPASPSLQEPASTQPQPERRKTPPPSPPEASKNRQALHYHVLVHDGGRPPCSLETLDRIYDNPADYVEMAWPWVEDMGYPPNPYFWGLFSRARVRWSHFRKWQRRNRGLDLVVETLEDFREAKRSFFQSIGLGELTPQHDFDRVTWVMWLDEKDTPPTEIWWEVPNGTFGDYVEAARNRLAVHGFTEAFQLLPDPKQQSDRVTWIEYLEFEYWFLDKRARAFELAQPRHDEAWQELVKSGFLLDGETEEQAREAFSQRPWMSESQTPRIVAIGEFVKKTHNYSSRKTDLTRSQRLVQWALDRMPEEEKVSEKKEESVREKEPEREKEPVNKENGKKKKNEGKKKRNEEEKEKMPTAPAAVTKPVRKTGKRGRQRDDEAAKEEPTEQPAIKRQKQEQQPGQEGTSTTARRKVSPRKATLRNTRITLGLECPVANTRVVNKGGPRRSARINKLGKSSTAPPASKTLGQRKM